MALKPSIWMPLYVADWDGKTRHLSCEQDGAYGRLVRFYWKNGAPPDDNAQLRQIVGLDATAWRKARPVLARFFQIRDGRWFHDRVEEELRRANEIISERSRAGKEGAKVRWQKDGKRIAEPSVGHRQNDAPAGVEVPSDRSEGQPNPIQVESTDSQEGSLGEGVVRFPGKSA